LLVIVGAVFLAGLYLAGIRDRWLHGKISEQDTIVLADFSNSTGDPIFDDTLKEALGIALKQSPFLNVLPERKVAATLRQMARPADTALIGDVIRELCQRAGSKAYVEGSIAKLDSEYALGLKAVNCQSGSLLAKELDTAASKEQVLNTLGRQAARMRGRLGESLATVQKFDVPIEATTSSLEALKTYSMGIKTKQEKGDAPSVPFLKRAIELDPNFPMAYNALAIAYADLQQPSLALEHATKAYQLRDRVSAREKLSISAQYFQATGEVEKAAQTYELGIADYPRSAPAHGNLGANYAIMGYYGKALTQYQEALRLAPDVSFNYANLGATYVNLNRLEEAKATFDQGLVRKLDSALLRMNIYLLAFLRGDVTQMNQELAWSAGKPAVEDVLLSAQSDTEAYYGRFNNAREFSRRAVDSAVRADSQETAALWQVNAALREAELGNAPSAKSGVTRALALFRGRDVEVLAALALARAGDAPRAKALAKELEKSYPTNTVLKFYWLPTIKAANELNVGNPSQALADLDPAAPYELALTGIIINNLYPVYARGQAYLLAHNGGAAAAEFQKMLDHPGIVLNFVTGALAHLQIGRAYAMAGDKAKAKAAYQEFLTLWKDADPDIPIYKQAKAEYAKLR